jgi:hypothetical protein
VGAYFFWTAKAPRSIGFGGFKLQLPTASVGTKLTSITIVDLVATSLTLYVLMPDELSQNFAFFFVILSSLLGWVSSVTPLAVWGCLRRQSLRALVRQVALMRSPLF